MEEKKEKKGILGRLIKPRRPQKSPCCGGFVIEEVPDERPGTDDKGQPSRPKKPSC